MKISSAFFVFVMTALEFEKGWTAVTPIPMDLVRYFSSKVIWEVLESADIGEKCSDSFSEWVAGVQRGEIWALEMADSMPKFLDGFMMGRFHYPGHFDECVSVRRKNFQGKHCMIRILPNSSIIGGDMEDADLQLPDSLDLLITYSYGLCAPSTCTTDEISLIFGASNQLTSMIQFMNLTESDCSTDEWRTYRTEDWIAAGIIAFFLTVAIASTLYDLSQKHFGKKGAANEILLSFSLHKNAKHLFGISRSEGSLKCIYGIRFLSMAWVILGHSFLTFGFGALVNFRDMPELVKSTAMLPVNNAFLAVDTFFFLSGLLACLTFFRSISEKGHFDVPMAFLHRYIRVTPPFALVMFLQATIVSRLGNGPFWNKGMDTLESQCRDSWWTGILYVQNYVKPFSLCLGQSWYLSADMQMFWLSPLILYPMIVWPLLAPYFLLLLLVAATLTNFTIAYLNEFDPNLSIALSKGNINQFKLDYIPFHTRLSSWLLGLITGYIICGIRSDKIRLNLSKTGIAIGWFVGLGLIILSFFMILRFMNHDYTVAESAMYLAFHRVGWTLGLLWIVLACISGYGGPINRFLSLDIFQPLAKLSYCLFLIHMSLQSYRLFSMRLNQYFRNYEALYAFMGDLMLSTLLAVPLYLLFELPFGKLDKHLLQRISIFTYPKGKKEAKKKEIAQKTDNTIKDLENGIANPNFRF